MTTKQKFGVALMALMMIGVYCLVVWNDVLDDREKARTNIYADWMFEFDAAAIIHHDTLLSICPIYPGYKFKVVHQNGDSYLMTDSGYMVAEWVKGKPAYHISNPEILDSVDRSWKKYRVYFGKHDFGYPIMDGQFQAGSGQQKFTAYMYMPRDRVSDGEFLNRDTTGAAAIVDSNKLPEMILKR